MGLKPTRVWDFSSQLWVLVKVTIDFPLLKQSFSLRRVANIDHHSKPRFWKRTLFLVGGAICASKVETRAITDCKPNVTKLVQLVFRNYVFLYNLLSINALPFGWVGYHKRKLEVSVS